MLMKMRCNRPSGINGITGLSDTKMAEILKVNRTTVYRARQTLKNLGLIREISKEKIFIENSFVTYSKYEIMV